MRRTEITEVDLLRAGASLSMQAHQWVPDIARRKVAPFVHGPRYGANAP